MGLFVGPFVGLIVGPSRASAWGFVLKSILLSQEKDFQFVECEEKALSGKLGMNYARKRRERAREYLLCICLILEYTLE